MKRLVLLFLCCLIMYSCAPKNIDYEQAAQDYISYNYADLKWSMHPSAGEYICKLICCRDTEIYSHDLKTGKDTLVVNKWATIPSSLMEYTDSSVVFSVGQVAVYKYDLSSKVLVNCWEVVRGDNKQYHLLDAFDNYILYVNVKDAERSSGLDLPELVLFSDEDVILHDINTNNDVVVDFISSDDTVINRKNLLPASSRSFYIYQYDHQFLFVRENNKMVELYRYAPRLGNTAIRERARGELVGYGLDENNRVYYTLKANQDYNIKYDYRAKNVQEIPTAKGYIKKEGIAKNDIVAITDKAVYFFKTKPEHFYEYSALYRYDSERQELKEFDKLPIDGREVTVSVKTARLSKDGVNIIVNCSSSAESYLFAWDITDYSLILIAHGNSITSTDTFYTVSGRNGSTQYYNLNGKEISEYEAGFSALGLSDLFNLL